MAFHDDREDDLENAMNKSSLWAVTYGDLMSYMMIFFLLLFVFGQTKNMRMQMGLHGMEGRFGGKKKMNLEEIFNQEGIQQFAKIELTPERLRLTFSQPVLFDSGKAEMKESGLPVLHRVADLLRDLPNEVMIEGHTDNVPVSGHSDFKNNWELSTSRAHRVLEYFVTREGIAPSRMVAIGYGEFRPVASNDTPEGQGANRRIEISIRRME
jgi:chemotaxis protein MotB